MTPDYPTLDALLQSATDREAAYIAEAAVRAGFYVHCSECEFPNPKDALVCAGCGGRQP